MNASDILVGIPISGTVRSYLIHHGRLFDFSKQFSLGNNASAGVLIQVGTSYDLCIFPEIHSTGGTRFMVYKGCEVASPGASFVPQNTNDRSTLTLDAEFYTDPVLTDFGTDWFFSVLPKGMGVQAGGGQVHMRSGRILESGSCYLLGASNTEVTSIDVVISSEMYQVSV